jgi:hypothetical protein
MAYSPVLRHEGQGYTEARLLRNSNKCEEGMDEFSEPLELSDSKLATVALAVVASAADWGYSHY